MSEGFRDLFWNSSDGLRLHARDYAPVAGGPARGTVVCVPGLTRNAADFDEVARYVAAAGWRVLAVDLRGRGQSERATTSATYNVRAYADDLSDLLRSQGVASAVFVGTSLGGLVAMTLARHHPALVAGAVVNDAGPQVPREALRRIGRYAGKTVPPMDAEAASTYAESIGKVAHPAFAKADWEAMARRMFRVRDDGAWELDYDPAIVKTASPFLLWLIRPLLWGAWRALARRGPVVLVRGALSDVLAPDVARRMVETSGNVTLAEVPGVGHAPTLCEPIAKKAVLDLLDRVA